MSIEPWRIGNWKNIPIFFHWSVLAWLPWYFMNNHDLTATLLQFFAMVILIYAHEFGHAIVARKNRVKVYSIKLYILHGQCTHESTYYESQDVLIAWGGVLAQFIILLLAIISRYLLSTLSENLYYFFEPVLFVFIAANTLLIMFNLLPVAPLDGNKAWRIVPIYTPIVMLKIKKLLIKFNVLTSIKKRRSHLKLVEQETDELMDRLKKNQHD
jgi:stage IV sporulation protein FB